MNRGKQRDVYKGKSRINLVDFENMFYVEGWVERGEEYLIFLLLESKINVYNRKNLY